MRPAYILFAVVPSLATAILADAATPARAEGCVTPTAPEIRQLHDRWIASLATMHPDKVLRNYAPDAVFIGLETPAPLIDFLSIRNHYVYFLQREPKIEVRSSATRAGCGTASDIGTMSMSARPRGNAAFEPLVVRYSVSYEHRDAKWLIVQHHLSLAEPPQTIANSAAAAVPSAKPPAVAGYLKRLPTASKRATTARQDQPATEQLEGGWTYTPGIWRPESGPKYQGD